MIDYKSEIIKMLNQLDDERFLSYLYTLVKEMLSKRVSEAQRVG